MRQISGFIKKRKQDGKHTKDQCRKYNPYDNKQCPNHKSHFHREQLTG